MRVQVCATPHTLACVFKCRGIRKHDFQFPDTASVPFNPETSKTEKESERERKEKNDSVWLNPAHSTTQQTKTVKWNSHHHRKETNKYPKSCRKRMNIKCWFLRIVSILLPDKSVFSFAVSPLHEENERSQQNQIYQISLKVSSVTDDLRWPVSMTSNLIALINQ